MPIFFNRIFLLILSFHIFIPTGYHPYISVHEKNRRTKRELLSFTSPVPTSPVSQLPTPIKTQIPTLSPSEIVTPTILLTITPTIMITPSIIVSATPPSQSALPISPTPTIMITSTPTHNSVNTSIPSPTPSVSASIVPQLPNTITQTSSLDITPISSPTPSLMLTSTSSVGNDISYPQCGNVFPDGQVFGIVGINDGISTTTNPCLVDELRWANTSPGTANKTKIELYVNTANPGGLNTSSWPKNTIDPLGNQTDNPFGNCDGSDSAACAWQYGWNRAAEDINNRFVPAAHTAGISQDPTQYQWWLDIETVNTWKSGSDSAYLSNVDDLEGMVSVFSSKGIPLGLYSTQRQWNDIVSSMASHSLLLGLPNWIPGATDLMTAQSNCSHSPFTADSTVLLTQFTMNNIDYDVSCNN